MDERMKEIQEIQQQIEERTKVEDEAIGLIGQCRFEEANVILSKI